MDNSGASDRGTPVRNLAGTSCKSDYYQKSLATGNSCKYHTQIGNTHKYNCAVLYIRSDNKLIATSMAYQAPVDNIHANVHMSPHSHHHQAWNSIKEQAISSHTARGNTRTHYHVDLQRHESHPHHCRYPPQGRAPEAPGLLCGTDSKCCLWLCARVNHALTITQTHTDRHRPTHKHGDNVINARAPILFTVTLS